VTPSAAAKSRWERLWTRELSYSCPHCQAADTARVSRLTEGENCTWDCPHCAAKLTILPTRKALRILVMFTFWSAMAAGPLRDGSRWIVWALLFLSLWLSGRMGRPQVALMPEPKTWE